MNVLNALYFIFEELMFNWRCVIDLLQMLMISFRKYECEHLLNIALHLSRMSPHRGQCD